MVFIVWAVLRFIYPHNVQVIPGQLNISALSGGIQNFNQVGIGGDVTGGSAKLYVNGNAGIGTTGPGAKLDVGGGGVLLNGMTGRNYFKDSEKSDGNGLRVGAAWGMYGVYAETGVGVVGGAGGVNLQNGTVVIIGTDGTIRGVTYGFGGMYRKMSESAGCAANPFTGGCSCPSGFTAFQVGQNGCWDTDCNVGYVCYK